MPAPGIRAPDSEGLIRQDPRERRPGTRGGSHSVDAVGDDVGARQRAAGDRVPDQRLADLAEHPLRLPDPGRVDLGSQRREHRAQNQAQDRDDDGKLDEGEPRLAPEPIVGRAHVAGSPEWKDAAPARPGASDAARMRGRGDVRRAREGV